MPLLNSGSDSAFLAADYLENSAKMLVIELDNWSARCDAGSVDAWTFINDFLLGRLNTVRNKWTVGRAVSGVEIVIRERYPGKFASDAAATQVLLDINNGMTTLIDWLAANVQSSLTNAAGYVEIMKVVNNAITYRAITNGASLAALKTQLQTLRSLIIG